MIKADLRLQRPRGTKDYLPQETRVIRAIEERIRTTFQLWGYAEVITPTFEHIDVLRQGTGPESDEVIFRFFDREGHTLGLRSDATTPIARLAATRFAESDSILRLAYLTNIFRYVDPGMGREREFHQAGVELIGSARPEADAEVIQLAAEVFSALEIPDYRLDLGEVSFIQGVLADSPESAKEQRAVRLALLNKDFVAFGEILAQAAIPDHAKQQLISISRLRGGVEVIAEARELTRNKQAHAALDRLEQVCDLLNPEVLRSVQLDLAMLKDLDYYTGVIFEGYVAELGYTVCTGGRYDRLIGRFGPDRPATGFAFGLERLLELVRWPDAGRVPVYLSYASGLLGEAHRLAELLRGQQIPTIWQLANEAQSAALHVEVLAPNEFRLTDGDRVVVFASPADVSAYLKAKN